MGIDCCTMRTVRSAGGGVGTGSAQRIEEIASGTRRARAIANPGLVGLRAAAEFRSAWTGDGARPPTNRLERKNMSAANHNRSRGRRLSERRETYSGEP